METYILVIEANPDLRTLFEHLIRADGYQTQVCSDWHAADEHIKQRLPDLVIYDWDLNNTAGFLWAEALHSSAATAKLPMLFVSDSQPSRPMSERLTTAGISFIDKPFDIFVFRRRVEALLGIRERALGV